jgi:hypothetical protein
MLCRGVALLSGYSKNGHMFATATNFSLRILFHEIKKNNKRFFFFHNSSSSVWKKKNSSSSKNMEEFFFFQ